MPPPDQHRDRHRTSTAVGTSSSKLYQMGKLIHPAIQPLHLCHKHHVNLVGTDGSKKRLVARSRLG